MLLAPLFPTLAEEIGVDCVPLLILLVITANSGSLLTLVGDPVTFIIGDAMGMGFLEYFWRLSLAGVVAVGTILVMLPWLFPKTWRKQLTNLEQLPHPQVNHPLMLTAGSGGGVPARAHDPGGGGVDGGDLSPVVGAQ